MPDIDALTGMPVVPEGYFWRVRTKQEEGYYLPTVFIELRKLAPTRIRPNRSKLVTRMGYSTSGKERTVYIYGYKRYMPLSAAEVEDRIRGAAFEVYKQHKDEIEYSDGYEKLTAKLANVSGDYPPKKLEV